MISRKWILAMVLGLMATANGGVFLDDFASGIRPHYWTVFQDPPGLYAVDDTHGDVCLTKVLANPGELKVVAL